MLSWTVFKPSIFSFPYLPPEKHIIPKYISNMHLIIGVCNTKTSPIYLLKSFYIVIVIIVLYKHALLHC